MAHDHRAPAPPPVRQRPPGVVPLELWDLELDAGILWDHVDGDALPGALVEAVARLRRGTARTRSRSPIPALAREIGAVWLAGGRAGSIDPEATSTALGLPVWVGDDPTAFAGRGARVLVPEASALAVIDLGQSRLKLYVGGRRFEHERPWDRLPLREGPLASEPVPARTARDASSSWATGACTIRFTPSTTWACLRTTRRATTRARRS